MCENPIDEGYRNIACAVIMQAIDDYRCRPTARVKHWLLTEGCDWLELIGWKLKEKELSQEDFINWVNCKLTQS